MRLQEYRPCLNRSASISTQHACLLNFIAMHSVEVCCVQTSSVVGALQTRYLVTLPAGRSSSFHGEQQRACHPRPCCRYPRPTLSSSHTGGTSFRYSRASFSGLTATNIMLYGKKHCCWPAVMPNSILLGYVWQEYLQRILYRDYAFSTSVRSCPCVAARSLPGLICKTACSTDHNASACMFIHACNFDCRQVTVHARLLHSLTWML